MSRNISPSIVGLARDTTNAEIDSLEVHGQNHNVSESDEGQRAQCEFCSTSRLSLKTGWGSEREASPLDHHQFFHEECFTCKPLDDLEMQLCDFCRHIRLRHIFGCLSKFYLNLFHIFQRLDLEADFGGLEAIRSRQNCGLCRLVANTVLIHGQESLTGSISSIPNFVRLRISLSKYYGPTLNVRSNLLKEATFVEFEGELLRASTFRGVPITRDWPAPLGEEISWDRILKSLPNITPSPTGRLPSHFRLIDVLQRRCVTVGPSFNGSFAALSYVWGSSMGVGQAGPAVDLHNPPHTIEDALHACKELCQQYLWIDQICINQDDPVDKANQIASMAAIYSSASLVIVAARGESVHSGISGMHLARQKLQSRESFLDFKLTSVPDFDRDISSSIWSTRGWTLQEVALANIKVYFSSTGVWLQYEEYGEEIRYSVDFDRFTSPDIIQKSTPFAAFSKHLREYTTRKLTYEYDIYNAFSGIITALFGGPDTEIYGLPEPYLGPALLWAPSEHGPPPNIRVFRDNLGHDPVLNPLLPSWSWASVTGKVKIPRLVSWGEMIPLVKWARIASSSRPSTPTLIDEEYQEGSIWGSKTKGTRLYLAILWSHSGFDSSSRFALLQSDDDTQSSLGSLTQRWPSPRDFWSEVSSRSSRSPTYPGLDIPGLSTQDDFQIAQLQPGVLLTRADCARVWVDPNGDFREGDHGALIGGLYGGKQGLIPQEDSLKAGDFKCVAISLTHELEETVRFTEKTNQDSGELRKGISMQNPEPFECAPVINVMLIGGEGEFSYRLGVGWVLFRRWIDLERVFETILLR